MNDDTGQSSSSGQRSQNGFTPGDGKWTAESDPGAQAIVRPRLPRSK